MGQSLHLKTCRQGGRTSHPSGAPPPSAGAFPFPLSLRFFFGLSPVPFSFSVFLPFFAFLLLSLPRLVPLAAFPLPLTGFFARFLSRRGLGMRILVGLPLLGSLTAACGAERSGDVIAG